MDLCEGDLASNDRISILKVGVIRTQSEELKAHRVFVKFLLQFLHLLTEVFVLLCESKEQQEQQEQDQK